MTDNLKMIEEAGNDAVGREMEVSAESHLIEDEILDSLDSAVFLLNVEKATGMKLPETEIAAQDLFRVSSLLAYLDKG